MSQQTAYMGDIKEMGYGHGPDDTWEVSNFKSLGKADVDCNGSHINILTGQNSIGKSSFIQSLLMFCQSVNYSDRVLLNGPLVSLGYPHDVIRSGTDRCVIRITFKTFLAISSHKPEDCTAEIVLRQLGSEADGTLSESLMIERIELTIDETYSYTIEQPNRDNTDYLECIKVQEDGEDEHFDFMKLKPRGKSSLYRTYVAFEGFMPKYLVRFRSKKESFESYRKSILNYLNGSDFSSLPGWILRRISKSFYDKGVKLSNSFIHGNDRSEAVRAFCSYTDDEQSSFVDSIAEQLSNNVSTLYRRIEFEYTRDTPQGDWMLKLHDAPAIDDFDSFSLVVNDLAWAIDRFAYRVQYIGPLRDDPRVVSPLNEITSKNLPVGLKGEQAATALLLRQGASGTFGLPKDHTVRTVLFETALDKWASYLGIAESIRASNLPKYGVGLSVSSRGLPDGDLTMIGVGASQVIPILIGVLSSPHGSIMLIEQPELHLHPSAQSRLADFFLYARPDLTYIIESHSEALITRFRRRVVEDSTLADRISFRFFEHFDAGQGVVARRLRIDDYGNLDEWPDGFMDAVQEDTRAILRGALDKRMAGR